MSAYVLTGTPGAGKTVLLRALELRGHPVVEKAATDLITLSIALGNPTPWTDPAFIDDVVRLQRRREPEAGFVDRSPVCTLALCRHLGFTPSALLTAEVEHALATYSRTVFFVRNLGSVAATTARQINVEGALVFERVHEATYRELGFTLVDVPRGSVADRVTRVEEALAGFPRRAPAPPDAGT